MAHNLPSSAVAMPYQPVRVAGSILVMVALLSLAGCASVPPPDGAMSQAQTRLLAARHAGAADYAPVDLGFAQDKFAQAQAAMAAHKYALAADLAEEASADASLATTKARLGAARAQLQSRRDENDRIRRQNEQARVDAQQQAAQEHAQLAGQVAPAASGSAGLPAQEPLPDLPPPPTSTLDAAPQPSSGGQP